VESLARRNLYRREDVVAAALEVVREHGFAQLSARRVADRLGASTAPVYSNFASMDELARAVKLAIADLVLAETAVPRSGEPFLDMGVGVLEFARQHPELYNAVFLTGRDDADADAGLRVTQVLLERMSRLEGLATLDPVERRILLRKMAVFTQGLAVHVTAGHTDGVSWEEVLALLNEVGRAVIADAFRQPPRSAAETALLANFCLPRTERPDSGPANDNRGETNDA
jgi:AcrR family transcriptional regulator